MRNQLILLQTGNKKIRLSEKAGASWHVNYTVCHTTYLRIKVARDGLYRKKQPIFNTLG